MRRAPTARDLTGRVTAIASCIQDGAMCFACDMPRTAYALIHVSPDTLVG